jgi:hypothetical protein
MFSHNFGVIEKSDRDGSVRAKFNGQNNYCGSDFRMAPNSPMAAAGRQNHLLLPFSRPTSGSS